MRKLQTYFAIFAAVLVLAMLLILSTYAILSQGADASILFAMIPLTAATLLIAFYLGRLLAKPLDDLNSRLHDWRMSVRHGSATEDRPASTGDSSDSLWQTLRSGRLRSREARMLSEAADELMELDETQRSTLALLEKRQTELVADIAHELRTPLTAIRGDAEVLMDPDLPPELHEKFCRNIVRESERLTRLTADLSTLLNANGSGLQQRTQPTDLRKVAEMAVGSLSPILHEKGTQVSISGHAPEVMCNPDRLEEVVSNLVDNASRFVGENGHIDIELSGADRWAVLSVSDDGPGFGDVDPRLLFERFYRTDFSRARNRGGSGLGLAIVKSIVESYGGTVDAANRPQGGARFTVRIPASD